MVLPDRDLGAAEEDVLPWPHFGPFLVNLNFNHVAWMLYDLRHERLVSSSDLSKNALEEVHKAAIHPVFPEDAGAEAERCGVGLDHAESAMNRPEEEEDDEEVMDAPETLVVCPPRLVDRGEKHGHEGEEHDVARPARASHEVGLEEANEAQFLLCSELSKVVPVSYCMDPGEKDNRERHHFVKRDIVVKLDDAVQWCLAKK